MKTTLPILLLLASSASALCQDDPPAVDPFVKGAQKAPGNALPPTRQVGVLVEFIQLDHMVANKMLRKHIASLSAAPLRGELEAMLDDGTAELIESGYVKSRAGQRAKVESVDELIYPTEFDPPEIPQTVTLDGANAPGTAANPTAFETRQVGTTVEVDPQISAEGALIDLNIAPEIVRYLGREYTVEERDDLGTYDPETLSSTIYQPKFYTMKHSTAVVVRDGDTVLLCTHRPEDAPDKTVMVLVRADIVK